MYITCTGIFEKGGVPIVLPKKISMSPCFARQRRKRYVVVPKGAHPVGSAAAAAARAERCGGGRVDLIREPHRFDLDVPSMQIPELRRHPLRPVWKPSEAACCWTARSQQPVGGEAAERAVALLA